jgi:hypothetical protein
LNYYIEGQNWLYRVMGLGGLYYDGNNGERAIQQRIRRMTETVSTTGNNTKPFFDVHGRAFEYVEFLAFFDSMWTCEGIDFTREPQYWLITIAALPFGVFGEMLGGDSCTAGPAPCPMKPGCGESCANRWRGLLFGMTNRAGWNGKDPNNNEGVWSLWDEFGIVEARMHGWWEASAPVKIIGAHKADVLATAWVRQGVGTLIAIGSWHPETVLLTSADVTIDWSALGLVPGNSTLTVPTLGGFNDPVIAASIEMQNCTGDLHIPVSGNKGWVLLIKPITVSQFISGA